MAQKYFTEEERIAAARARQRKSRLKHLEERRARDREAKKKSWASLTPEEKAGRYAYQKQWRAENGRADSKRYYQNHKEKVKAKAKAWREANPELHRTKAYGMIFLPEQTIEQMLKEQDNKCKICFRSFGDEQANKFQVDHSHEPGKEYVRALLCVSCNNGLGRFKENSVFLRIAADYLDFHQERLRTLPEVN